MNRVSHEKFSILDFLFENKNKEYGAYELRKHYISRMYIAISGVVIVSICLFVILLYPKNANASYTAIKPSDTLNLIIIPPVELPIPEHPIPPVPPPTAPETPRAIQYSTPIFVDDIVESNIPPMEEIEFAAIATFNRDGIDTDIPAIVEAISNEVVNMPPAHPDNDVYFEKVEIESQYPAGLEAWKRYLQRTLVYPAEAVDNIIEGMVVVEFKVDENGKVFDVKAISGPQELRTAAEKVIRKSGSWTPAIQNGRQVKSIKKQPIKFQLGL